MLWFLQHYLWELALRAATRHRRSTTRGTSGYAPVNAAFAEAVLEELEREPEAAVFFHDYHLYLAPRLVRERAPGRAARALRAHPVAAAGLLARAARTGSGARSTTGCSPTTSSASTRRAGARTSCARASDARSAPTRDFERRRGRTTTGARTLVTRAPDLGRPGTSSTSSPRASAVLAAERELVARAAGAAHRCASTAPTRRRTSCAASARSSSTSRRIPRCTAASACSRCSTRRVRTSPSTPSTSARSSARRARVNDRFQRDGWTPIDLEIEDNFAGSVAAYKQFDVLLRERDLRRA